MTAREAALKALYNIEQKGAYTNSALKRALSEDGLTNPDKRMVTEIIYGVIANKTAIDYIISRYSKVKMKKLSPWVLSILRMGVYQIHYMDKIPHSAVCNEGVKLAKKYSHGAGAGFVNGVLRSVSRGLNEFYFPQSGDIIEDLSLEYSYPKWMTKALVDEYGKERVKALFEENRKPHGVAIRVNCLKSNADTVATLLSEEELVCRRAEGLDNALMVRGSLNVDMSPAYKSGLFSLQNLSSQKAVKVLDPKPNDTVIDMCAAPGGKSCAAAELMKNCGLVLSFDVFEHKIQLIEAAADRLGISIIKAEVSDSTVAKPQLLEKADRVLADVPCSGLGVIHKKPDIKWSRSEDDIKKLCELQKKILDTAAGYVKLGGVLVYSTCTILPEENRLRIDEFLSEHTEFKKDYEEQILTSQQGESGFYICRMLKG